MTTLVVTAPLGVPWPAWGAGCFLVAIIWVIVWPRDRVGARRGARYVILRWFHALCWSLLAAAAFVASWNAGAARIVGLAALLTYLTFMFTFVTSPRTDTGTRDGAAGLR